MSRDKQIGQVDNFSEKQKMCHWEVSQWPSESWVWLGRRSVCPVPSAFCYETVREWPATSAPSCRVKSLSWKWSVHPDHVQTGGGDGVELMGFVMQASPDEVWKASFRVGFLVAEDAVPKSLQGQSQSWQQTDSESGTSFRQPPCQELLPCGPQFRVCGPLELLLCGPQFRLCSTEEQVYEWDLMFHLGLVKTTHVQNESQVVSIVWEHIWGQVFGDFEYFLALETSASESQGCGYFVFSWSIFRCWCWWKGSYCPSRQGSKYSERCCRLGVLSHKRAMSRLSQDHGNQSSVHGFQLCHVEIC